jgi:hypothetical protein
MRDRYEPTSEFLKAVIADEAPLSGNEWAEQNLRLLMELMRDEDSSNRDWATFLLAQEDPSFSLRKTSTPRRSAVRCSKLRRIVKTSSEPRRCSDWQSAMPIWRCHFVQQALRADSVSLPMLEAAKICAHPSLIPDLLVWAEPSGHAFADELAAVALAACQRTASADR